MDSKESRRLRRTLGLPGLFVLTILALIPALFEVGSRNEGNWFPVVVPLIDDNDTPDIVADDQVLPIIAAEYPSSPEEEPYVDILVQFNKIRSCDFLIDERVINGEVERINRSLTWYSATGERLRIDLDPESADLPPSRPTGPQVGGPWRIYGVRTMQGSVAVVAHRCHPLWLTYSQFYP